MQRSASAAAKTPRTSNMSPRQRRGALTDLIGAGIAHAVASRDFSPDGRASPGLESFDALALSPESRLSVGTRADPARNEPKAGERA